jgi:hypothetical protein
MGCAESSEGIYRPEKETQAYLIAKGHLGTSFTLEKSNGYLSWLKDQDENYRKVKS